MTIPIALHATHIIIKTSFAYFYDYECDLKKGSEFRTCLYSHV